MVQCEYCGFDPGISYSQCSLCGGTFCRAHKLPQDHQCVKLKEWNNEDGVKKTQATSYIPSTSKRLKFHKIITLEFTSLFNKVKTPAYVVGYIAALMLGIGMIIFGVYLFVGNRTGLNPTFPYAGFITMSFGFVIVAYLLKS
jgi:hypothetical protein